MSQPNESNQTDKTITAADKVALFAILVAIGACTVAWMNWNEAEELKTQLNRNHAKITQTIECGGN